MAIVNCSLSSVERKHLYDISCLQLDEHDNWLRPEYPKYKSDLAQPKPFLVPSFDNEVVEILPSVKQNRKINFDENIYVMDIENRFQMMLEEEQIEQDDEVSYEIEIVEGGQTDDADFYLEMIDGEIFYVFETEDDISVESEEEEEEGSDESSSTEDQSSAVAPLQLDIGGLMAPNLNESYRSLSEDQPMYIPDDEDNSECSESVNENVDRYDGNIGDDSSSSSDQLGFEVPAQLQIDQMIIDAESKHFDVTTEATSAESTVDSTILLSPLMTQISTVDVTSNGNLMDSTTEETNTTKSDSIQPTQVVDFVPTSPTQQKPRPTMIRSNSAGESMRSILRSPQIESPKKVKKEKKSPKQIKSPSKKKTFTKTYVRADDFDGEHRVFAWEKPSWAESSKLRSTEKGDAILQGANLAQPITDTKKILESGKVKWEKPDWASLDGENDDDDLDKNDKISSADDDINAKEELIRKIQTGRLNLPSTRKGGSRLKITLNGSCLRDGSDIVKPITKATVIKKPSNVNTVANPKILRATPTGSKVREGHTLEAPTTQATQLKKYTFERPTWTHGKLRSTQAGDILKKGGDVALAITPATAEHNQYKKEEWKGKRGIGRQASASIAEEMKRKDYSWSKPSWAVERNLRKTTRGDAVRAGVGLSRPITSLPHLTNVTENGMTDEDANVVNTLSKDLQNSLRLESSALEEEEPSGVGNRRAASTSILSTIEGDTLRTRGMRLNGEPPVTRSMSLD
jgi:hypothetical protein